MFSLSYEFFGHPNCVLEDNDDFDNILSLFLPLGIDRVEIWVKEEFFGVLDDDVGRSSVVVYDSSLCEVEKDSLDKSFCCRDTLLLTAG